MQYANDMKYYELDKEEKEILDAFEKGEFVSVPNVKKEIARYRSYAIHTLNRNRNINVRLSERDLHKLKVKAQEEGLPYQTLIASLLHKFVSR
jgi:predicted DNA binding CopG/RHH family protein